MDLRALAITLRGAASQLDELASIFGGIQGKSGKGRKGTKRVLSASARAAISKAQKARWAAKKKSA